MFKGKGTEFHQVTGGTLQMFKVRSQSHRFNSQGQKF